jgi:hypothetical protein
VQTTTKRTMTKKGHHFFRDLVENFVRQPSPILTPGSEISPTNMVFLLLFSLRQVHLTRICLIC